MNALDVLRYGHETVLGAVERIPEDAWNTPGAAGHWSPKDVIGHLGAFELLFGEVLETLEGPEISLLVRAWGELGEDAWNEEQWARRRRLDPRAVVEEYTYAAEHVLSLAGRVPPEIFATEGLLPWYGEQYSLDDFITYSVYGHKREHTAQVAAFLDRWAHHLTAPRA